MRRGRGVWAGSPVLERPILISRVWTKGPANAKRGLRACLPRVFASDNQLRKHQDGSTMEAFSVLACCVNCLLCDFAGIVDPNIQCGL